jgi:hypothetical protein
MNEKKLRKLVHNLKRLEVISKAVPLVKNKGDEKKNNSSSLSSLHLLATIAAELKKN